MNWVDKLNNFDENNIVCVGIDPLIRKIDNLGLDEMDIKILKALVFNFNGGPVGLDSLGVVVSENPKTIEEVYKYRLAGGGTIVDVTSIGIGRDPLALARISRATELNIVMGGSYYVIDSHPEDMSHRTEDSLTEQIVKDVTIGVGDTGVKTGVIGEIGNYYPIGENETKILRASAQAQVETGAPILIHPGIHPESPLQILKVLTDNGASADNIIFGHLDNIRPMSAIKELASSGCYLEYDRFGAEDTSFEYESGQVSTTSVSDAQRLESLDYLISEGLGSQITMAHDVCLKPETVRYGGRGFAHILDSIIPRMLKRGISQQQIEVGHI